MDQIKRILDGGVPLLRELRIGLTMFVGHVVADSGVTS
jgi:hypothetical protein